MSRFYEVVVKYDKMNERGMQQSVTELYLVLAVSCTDAEATLTGYIKEFVVGSCMDITSVKLAKYSEYIPSEDLEADRYFAVKLSFIMPDGTKEKRTAVNYVVHAASVEDANKAVVGFMKGGMIDYEVNNVVETKIVDVISE